MKQGLFRTLVGAVRSNLADVREAALALLAVLVQHPGVVTAAKQARSLAKPHLYQHRPPREFYRHMQANIASLYISVQPSSSAV